MSDAHRRRIYHETQHTRRWWQRHRWIYNPKTTPLRPLWSLR